MKYLKSKIAEDIWHNKYKYNQESLDEFFDRVSGGDLRLKELMKERKFLFGGRALAARDTTTKTSLFNCYVVKTPEDNLEDIYRAAFDMAKTYSTGGGSGVNISKLRPKGAPVNNAAKTSTGAVSFMELFDTTTGLISQNGRRGALMITLSVDHPDIEDFIKIKQTAGQVTKANISVMINDDFMKAVKDGGNWVCKFVDDNGIEYTKEVKARTLFRKIAEGAHNWAEPGILNWSRIENWHLRSGFEDFVLEATNPCGEQPLPAGGSCNLGALNLSEFVVNKFEEDAYFDFEDFDRAVETATVALDDLIDDGMLRHALKVQTEHSYDWRSIGLGIMGYADMLIKLGIVYGSDECISFTRKLAEYMLNKAATTSAMLAKAERPFPAYNLESIHKSKFYQETFLPTTKQLVELYGLKNSSLLTIAPTGTISTMLGVSGGVEPVYNLSYIRKTETLHMGDHYYRIYTPIVEEYMEYKGLTDESELPKEFVTAMTINPMDRIRVQAVWQHYVDSAISSTINLPTSVTVKQVEDIYMKAWEYGLKGVTVFRDGCARTGVLLNDAEMDAPKMIKKLKEDKCPLCNGEIIKTGGCEECRDCGWSKCSI